MSGVPPGFESKKKEVCRYFAQSGTCFYGDKCNYSHVLPGTSPSSSSSPAPQQQPSPVIATGATGYLSKSQRPCRNIQLYGFCKYAGKGCEFNHDIPTTSQQPSRDGAVSPSIPTNSTTKTKVNMGPQRAMGTYFVDEALRTELAMRSIALHHMPRMDDPRVKLLPSKVHRYHSLVRLDAINTVSRQPRTPPTFPGFQTFVYRCVGTLDGLVYTLRQVENMKAVSDRGRIVAELWQQKMSQHPNIVRLRDVFISSEIGEVPSLCVVYDFCPGYDTLENHLNCVVKHSGSQPMAEHFVWSAVIQLLSAVSAASQNSLSLKQVMTPSKILIAPATMRLKINCCGLYDIVSGVSSSTAAKEDLIALGRIAMAIALQNPSAATPTSNQTGQFLEQISRSFSTELHSFISLLVSGGGGSGVKEMTAMIADRVLQEASNAALMSDSLEEEVMKEMQNGRVVRLMTKLALLRERLEPSADAEWTDSGDRYLLALFLDHLFCTLPQQQQQESDQQQQQQQLFTSVDMGRIIDCLNKLDVGSCERLVLVSRDESTALVVTYSEIKQALEHFFLQ